MAKLLGPVTASIGGIDIDLGPPRQRAVFAALAAHVDQVVSREELVEAVWGIDAPVTALASIYTYIARLRTRLEPTRELRGPAELLISDGSGYTLRLPPQQIDVQRFKTYLENSRRLYFANAIHSAVGEAEAALALWHGTPYGGTTGPFAESERARLGELRLAAMEDRGEMLLELGRHADIVGELLGLARRHPLRERPHHLLMHCYLRLGRRADALTEYHNLRVNLAERLGIEPSEQLQQFYKEILSGGPSRGRGKNDGWSRPAETGEARVTALAQLARDVPGFAGRAAELRHLHDLVTAAGDAGEWAVAVVTGGPGVGKSALAVHLAHAVSRRFPDGQLHLDLRGFGEAGQPMEPAEALGHLVSALGAAPDRPTDVERQSMLYRSLVAGRRMLILLDNAVSVEQVRPLLPGASSCVVVVTSRNRLSGLVVREGARRITLDVMREDDAIELLSTVVGRTFRRSELPAVSTLVAACGRLPLALRILGARINASPAADIAEFTDLDGLEGGDLLDRFAVPGDGQSSLGTVLGWSYCALSEQAAAMFRALGRCSGPEFSLMTAAALAGTDVCEARRALDGLVDANLVQEAVKHRFRMSPLVFAYARQLTDTSGPDGGRSPDG